MSNAVGHRNGEPIQSEHWRKQPLTRWSTDCLLSALRPKVFAPLSSEAQHSCRPVHGKRTRSSIYRTCLGGFGRLLFGKRWFFVLSMVNHGRHSAILAQRAVTAERIGRVGRNIMFWNSEEFVWRNGEFSRRRSGRIYRFNISTGTKKKEKEKITKSISI